MAELPNDSIAQSQSVLLEYWRELDIKGEDLVRLYVVADLPAEAATLLKAGNDLVDHSLLPRHVDVQPGLLLVTLSDVVWR
ncbi:MAG: hypothetical protein DDT26_02739 [Dehalococcoidia bacterium]|nr:hypothetical protein [Chloroflexota bacterium]